MSIFTKASNASYWRGFNYYESNLVSELKKIGENVYQAKVKGSKTYDVVVDLDHPLNSKCTCPFTEGNHKMCKHMLAVAFMINHKEAKNAKKIRDDYEAEEKEKEELLESKMKLVRARIKQRVDSMSEEEIREILCNYLINDEYDYYYKEIYGDDYY